MKQKLTRGIFKGNPLFALLLGLCPALAITDRLSNAIGMGICVIFVLISSALVISLLKNFIPDSIRLPAHIIIIAALVTTVDLLLQAFFPLLSEELGIYVNLIAVNCIVLSRLNFFRENARLFTSLSDAFSMGLGFLLSLSLIAFFREALGSGTLSLFPLGNFDGVLELAKTEIGPASILSGATGAFLIVGYLKAFFNWIEMRRGQ